MEFGSKGEVRLRFWLRTVSCSSEDSWVTRRGVDV